MIDTAPPPYIFTMLRSLTRLVDPLTGNKLQVPSFAIPTGLKRWLVAASIAAGLVIVLAVGSQLRTKGMYPVSDGLLYEPNYDEGVYVAAAQLWLQGFVPYRDYLFPQPPLAVILMAGVLKTHFVPWGDATSFVYERYAATACGLLALLGVFALAWQLGGKLAGLTATALLAIDGLVVRVDRSAILEPYVNAFSILALICYLFALERGRSRIGWLLAAGALGACAALVKTAGAVTLAAILLYAVARLCAVLLQTRFLRVPAANRDSIKAGLLDLTTILAGAAAVSIPLVGYFAVTAPDSFVRQVYLLQLVRPTDGTPSALERLSEILNYDSSHLTIYLAGAGLALVVLRGLLRRTWGQWGLILLWTATIVTLLALSHTFYPHYYVQLAVPLAVLGGGLVSRERVNHGRGGDGKHPALWTSQVLSAGQIVLCSFLVVSNWGAGQTQYARGEALATVQSTLLRDVSRVLSRRTSPSGSLLVFHPAYALAASRKMAGPADGQFMIDSYAYMQYLSLGLDGDWPPESSNAGVMDLLHGESAQAKIKEIAARADYILLEQRAGWQLNPETITAMTIGYHVIYTKGKVSLWGKN